MFIRLLTFLTFCAFSVFARQSTNHAVLVAGSHGYGNYRHHADVCHAYHILAANGVPEENIIVMLYDDVANDPMNPFPGTLFNAPSTNLIPGVDVYKDCQKDYTGNDVTAANFLAVLTGNQGAVPKGMKVLNSTSEDRVFVNFADHGGSGILAMPSGPFLYQPDLLAALKKMHQRKMYKKLVFYVEACESGSMFENFPRNLSIYVTTAANADESSWGTYCPPNDSVFYNNESREVNSCLGDLYSVNWMQNADEVHDSRKRETLLKQYQVVKNETNLSHVQQFGTLAIDKETVRDYEGDGNVSLQNYTNVIWDKTKPHTSVTQYDATLLSLFYTYLKPPFTQQPVIYKQLMSLMEGRRQLDTIFSRFGEHQVRSMINETPCLKEFYETLRNSTCGHNEDGSTSYVAEYALKYAGLVKSLCNVGTTLLPEINALTC